MDDQDKKYRREFLSTTLKTGFAFALSWTTLVRPRTTQGANLIQPDTVLFKDDGVIPNSHYALLPTVLRVRCERSGNRLT